MIGNPTTVEQPEELFEEIQNRENIKIWKNENQRHPVGVAFG